MKALPKDKSIRIIDIGCGIGRLMNQIYRMGYHNIEGIDFSPVAIKRLKELYPHLKARVGDITKEDLTGYDLAVMTEVLEHLPEGAYRFPESFIASVPNGETTSSNHLRTYEPEDLAKNGAEIFYVGKWIVFGRVKCL